VLLASVFAQVTRIGPLVIIALLAIIRDPNVMVNTHGIVAVVMKTTH
jgi:hypothetical protein